MYFKLELGSRSRERNEMTSESSVAPLHRFWLNVFFLEINIPFEMKCELYRCCNSKSMHEEISALVQPPMYIAVASLHFWYFSSRPGVDLPRLFNNRAKVETTF